MPRGDSGKLGSPKTYFYSPTPCWLRFVLRILIFDIGELLTSESAMKFISDDLESHLTPSRRVWGAMVERLAPRYSGRVIFPHFVLSHERRLHFFKQRCVRAFHRDFSVAYSIYFHARFPVVLLLPAPRWLLAEAARQMGWSPRNRFELFCVNAAIRFCAVVFFITCFVEGLKSAFKSWLIILRSIGVLLAKGGAKRERYNVFFWGHKDAATWEEGKLSEPVFWREVVEAYAAHCGEELRVLIVNGCSGSHFVKYGRIDFIEDLLKLAPVFRPGECARLIGSIAAVIFRAIQVCRTFGVSDDIRSVTVAAILKAYSAAFVVVSNSALRGGPLVEGSKLAGIPTAMLFYSSNNSPLPTLTDANPAEHPGFCLMDHDVYFSWGRGMRYWLINCLNQPPKSIIEVGPVMFASTRPLSPAKSPQRRPLGQVNVGFFDVTPLSFHKAFELGLGRGAYRAEHCIGAFELVLNACMAVFGGNWNLLIKYKRKLNAEAHDFKYLEKLDSMLEPLGERVHRFDPDHNPWGVLSECDFVLGMPFTSMVDAGVVLDKPACFVFPPVLSINRHPGGIAGFSDSQSLGRWIVSEMRRMENRSLNYTEINPSANIARFLAQN